MAKFFVGQRVKLVRATNPQNNGMTGTIVRFEDTPLGTLAANGLTTIHCNCVVNYDADRMHFEHTDRLEPATDSYDVTTWDSCVWQPEHLRVGV